MLTGYTRAYKEKIQVAGSFSASCPPIETPVRALVVEPELDLQHMYSICLRFMGFKEVVFADSGKKCLDEIIKITDIGKNKNTTKGFDIIILDTYTLEIFLVFRLLKGFSIENQISKLSSRLLCLSIRLGKTLTQLESRIMIMTRY